MCNYCDCVRINGIICHEHGCPNKTGSLSKKIEEHEINERGIQSSSYYQGAGTSFTQWEDVAVGIGANKHDALEDALEQLASQGYDTEGIVNEYTDSAENIVCANCGLYNEEQDGDTGIPCQPYETDNCEQYFFIEVYVK